MKLNLPKPELKGSLSLEECIYNRESVRSFKDKEIELEKISQLLWSAQGKKGSKKTVPSAGATYPLEIFVVIKNKGFYYYNSESHSLETKFEGKDYGKALAEASLSQYFIREAALNIIICAEFSRTCNRYGERGVRYVLIEVGHCAQNIHLEAVALGLDSVPIGAFNDKEVKNVLKLPNSLEPLYIIPIGYAK
ncbi:MAG TPA: SagB/ThcOx family dehydrogenase [Candidatus Lokiarchaeia archaeon]